MKKKTIIEQLKEQFIKAKQNESLECPVMIEDFILPHLSESEKRELRSQLEDLVIGEEEFIQLVKSSINLDKLWQERISPGLTARLLETKHPSTWQRIKNFVRHGQEAYSSELQKMFSGYILNFQQAKPVQANLRTPFKLNPLKSPNVDVLIQFICAQDNENQGTLYMHFQPRNRSDSKSLNGIRLILCDLNWIPIKPKKVAKIRKQLAKFKDVDISKQYKVRVS